MSSNPSVNGVTIDETAQSMLWLLRDADTQRSAGQLVDELKTDKTHRIRYRLRRLRKAGLIDHVDTEKQQQGAQNPTKYYEINEDGLEWLYEHQEDVEDAVGRKRYLESLEQLRGMLMDMREEVRDLDADLEDLEADVDAALEELADLVEDHHETLNRRIQNEQTERKEAVSSVENKLDQFDHRITQLEASIEAAEPLDLAMRLNQVESQMAQHDDELDHVWRRIGYNARELLDLNLAKLLSGGPDPTEPGENGPPQRHKFT